MSLRNPLRLRRSGADPTLKFTPTTDLESSSDPSSLRSIAARHSGTRFVKWLHYFDVYDRHMSEFLAERARRGLTVPLRVLEIGVWRGGSLELWREFLGDDAVIFGVDIDPESARVPSDTAKVRTGSQTDQAFMREVLQEMGGVDLIVDDGSHRSQDVLESLRFLYPALACPGLYIIEDLHTSYWADWGGGFKSKRSSLEQMKSLVDVLHAPYTNAHVDEFGLGLTHASLKGVHFYDSMVVLEKDVVPEPTPYRGGSWGDEV
jgi:hypothetical protein